MALILDKNEVCKYSKTCKYNSGYGSSPFCIGSDPNRNTVFLCDLVDDKGVIIEDKFRSNLDKTGKMKIILEEEKNKNG